MLSNIETNIIENYLITNYSIKKIKINKRFKRGIVFNNIKLPLATKKKEIFTLLLNEISLVLDYPKEVTKKHVTKHIS